VIRAREEARSRARPLAAVALLTACDSGYAMRGRVREAGACDDPEKGARAAPAAKVEVTCPGVPDPILEAVVKPDGTFEDHRIGTMNLACTIRVTKSGFVPRIYRVEELCARYHESLQSCFSFSLDTLLARDPAFAAAARSP
jgi:hypothetical protein